MSVFLLFVAALAVAVAAGLSIIAFTRGHGALARRAGAAGAGAVVLYAGALIVVNAGSAPVLLGPGEREAFCGAYLDCHVGLAVTDLAQIELAGRPVHVVTIRLSSDARRATLSPPPLDLRVVDGEGRMFERDRWAEGALGLDTDLDGPLAAGGSRITSVAFALPGDARELRLRAELEDPVARSVEGLLIGDAHGLFHPPVDHALTRQSPDVATSVAGR